MASNDKKPRMSRTRTPPRPETLTDKLALPGTKTSEGAVAEATTGYWTVDLATRVVTWSKGLYAIYGLNPDGHKPSVATQLDIYGDADTATITNHFQRAVNTGEDFDFTVSILRVRDNQPRLIQTKGGVEIDACGIPTRLCAVVRDITPARADTVVHVPDETFEINAAKNDFLAHITNELRAPLNDIVAYAKRLNEPSLPKTDVAAYAQSLLTSARTLSSVIGETLDPPAAPVAARPSVHPVVRRPQSASARTTPVIDDNRINRAYLRALLRDMRQNLH